MVTHRTGTIEYTIDCLMPVGTIYTIHILKFSAHQLLTLLACRAIVSVVFEKQRKTEEWDFQWLACAKNGGASAKIKKRKGKEGRFLPSLSPSPSLSFFLALAPFFAQAKHQKSCSRDFLCSPTPRNCRLSNYDLNALNLWLCSACLLLASVSFGGGATQPSILEIMLQSMITLKRRSPVKRLNSNMWSWCKHTSSGYNPCCYS